MTAHASSTLSVAGSGQFTVETDGTAPNAGDAVKTFVDANIQITPPTATNPLNTTHVLTGHVNVNDGSGGFVNAPNGTTIDFAIVSGPGHVRRPEQLHDGGRHGLVHGDDHLGDGRPDHDPGRDDVTVDGLSLHRETGDGKAGDSADATKLWATPDRRSLRTRRTRSASRTPSR